MGGNVFKDAEPFDHASIAAIQKQINSVLSKINTKALPIGSGATPTPGKVSGDLDMIVDADALSNYFKTSDIAQVRKELRNLFDQAGFQTGQSGVSVHVRADLGKTAHQVDLMIVPNAEIAQKFHIHDIPKGSKYKGVHKQIALSALAKDQGLLWSAYEGLWIRGPDGKKSKLYTNDIEKIAQTLLGPNASAKDLGSYETILAALPKERADALNAKMATDKIFQDKLVKDSIEIARLKELAGL